MMKGKIKNVQHDKSFGFIRDEQGNDYFFHRSVVVNGEFDKLRKNDPVEFEGDDTPRGLRAEQVIRL